MSLSSTVAHTVSTRATLGAFSVGVVPPVGVPPYPSQGGAGGDLSRRYPRG